MSGVLDDVLTWLLGQIPDPVKRYRQAQRYQDHYQQLADEAGRVKMRATVDAVAACGGDVEEAARRLGRDAQWVRDVVRVMR